MPRGAARRCGLSCGAMRSPLHRAIVLTRNATGSRREPATNGLDALGGRKGARSRASSQTHLLRPALRHAFRVVTQRPPQVGIGSLEPGLGAQPSPSSAVPRLSAKPSNSSSVGTGPRRIGSPTNCVDLAAESRATAAAGDSVSRGAASTAFAAIASPRVSLVLCRTSALRSNAPAGLTVAKRRLAVRQVRQVQPSRRSLPGHQPALLHLVPNLVSLTMSTIRCLVAASIPTVWASIAVVAGQSAGRHRLTAAVTPASAWRVNRSTKRERGPPDPPTLP